MIAFYPGGNRRFQYKGYVMRGLDPKYEEYAIRSQIERGALDFMRAIQKEFKVEQETVNGILVSLDVIAMPIAEYEKIMQDAYTEGQRDEMRRSR